MLARMSKLRRDVKALASKILPDSERLRYLLHLPKLERWRRSRAATAPRFADRVALYRHLQSEVLAGAPISYLEFGVYRGDSLRVWTELNRHPQSHFYGFDTFTGLPDEWRGFASRHAKGVFDVGGRTPEIPDQRVSFVVGLFQESLPAFLASHSLTGQRVLHIDCDLYGSSLYVLTRCDDILVAGSVVIFDEFSAMLHEFRSLEDYCASYRRDYEVLGAVARGAGGGYFSEVAIRMR